MDKNVLGEALIDWYKLNKRDLPWRQSSDPYVIWLSEIILQQTRVDQGISYFYKFVNAYPTVVDLANAPEDEILKMWQGLGYYSRARNLHSTAKIISTEFNGKFPNEYKDILGLKGIGDYTAAAIASFAFNKPHAVVDGNVYRVLSRYFGIETPIDSGQGKKEFSEIANEILNKKIPGIHNQAMMEFGALHCKPANPKCDDCPVAATCFALNKNKIELLPVKSKKTKVVNRYFNYLHIHDSDKLIIKKRGQKDIWQGLYDFPLIETNSTVSIDNIVQEPEWKYLFGKAEPKILSVSKEYIHKLSHQKIHSTFIEISINNTELIPGNEESVHAKKIELDKYAVPRLIDIYLTDKNS